MIASLRGAVASVGLDHAVVEVGGVGMLVHTTPATAASLRHGQEAQLHTSLVVREDSLTLFGFGEAAERDLFEQVQTVSGVGPRLALAMLAVHPPQTLRVAISGGDVLALTKVPGIGRKGAERIVLELRDKVGGTASEAAAVPQSAGSPARGQVTEALVGLGWSAKQADDAVDKVLKVEPDASEVSAMLRLALRELGR
ncbi:Holliday junction branch migration protein RuvA [Luteipulveratus halotolerans]|uniref:Holliday junction branch migration complex subunit RuvA n=1 Tax=Luteipulveratus halotolerans TaxID=1631356 RepID=A0A0L6CH76_9MICO|nr:Holliday junction branch migration protein RuvA [Luteipulveratus halotolerans]KNX37157.1 ATP-dependent DNA helicase RuvA [Luteipulveratus halotolerans]